MGGKDIGEKRLWLKNMGVKDTGEKINSNEKRWVKIER